MMKSLTDRSKAVSLFQFFIVCTSVVSLVYVAFALSLFSSLLFWSFGKAARRYLSISWVSSLIYANYNGCRYLMFSIF